MFITIEKCNQNKEEITEEYQYDCLILLNVDLQGLISVYHRFNYEMILHQSKNKLIFPI